MAKVRQKKPLTTNAGGGVRKRDPHSLLVGSQTCADTVELNVEKTAKLK